MQAIAKAKTDAIKATAAAAKPKSGKKTTAAAASKSGKAEKKGKGRKLEEEDENIPDY